MANIGEERFSLVIGGPFYRLLQRCRLLGADRLPTVWAALLLAAVAWVPPALLSIVKGDAWDLSLGGRVFFLDFSVPARFIICIVMFLLMERAADRRTILLVRQFSDAGLVRAEDRAAFISAVGQADRKSSSAIAEAVIVGLAYAASATSTYYQLQILDHSWIGSWSDAWPKLSPAGWWNIAVSLPLFWFLMLRWFWRFFVWTQLLWQLAGMKLDLVATHPDRAGGLGFLEYYPTTFTALIFGLSCVSASEILQELVFAHMSLVSMGALFTAWVVIMLAIFVGPLLVFLPPLVRLQERSLLAYSTFAGRHNRAFHAKWLESGTGGADALGAADISSVSDLGAAFEAIDNMKMAPIGLETLVPLLVAIGLPWLAVLATQFPIVDIIKVVAQALL